MPPPGQPPKPPTSIELARQPFDPFDPRHARAAQGHTHHAGSCCGGKGAGASAGASQGKRAGGGRGGCCGGKDLGPMSKFEEPSADDIERFSEVTRTCPECKGTVHDDAEICYHCGHVFGDGTVSTIPPWVISTAAILALAIVSWFVL